MIFTISNQKGGVGKTTTALNLATYLAEAGKRVLLIDLDPQANLTSGLGLNRKQSAAEATEKRITIYDIILSQANIKDGIVKTRQKNLDLIPASIDLAGAEVELVGALSRETILQNALVEIKGNYDYIFIDCPPSLGILPINAFVASDLVLIPVQCEYFALEGLSQLMNTISLVKNRLNQKLDIGGVILTMFDTRTNLSKQVADEIRAFFKDKVMLQQIPRNIKLAESPSFGKSIFEYDSSSTGAEAYRALAEEFITRFS